MSYKFSEFNKLGQNSMLLRIGPLRSLNAFYSLLSGEAIGDKLTELKRGNSLSLNHYEMQGMDDIHARPIL